MQAPLRRYITAGVALVGASAIAVASNAAAPPEITIANPAVPSVQLTASPFDPYLAALAEARENIEDLILQAIADPALPPGLSLENLIGGLIDDPEANFEAFVACPRHSGLPWNRLCRCSWKMRPTALAQRSTP